MGFRSKFGQVGCKREVVACAVDPPLQLCIGADAVFRASTMLSAQQKAKAARTHRRFPPRHGKRPAATRAAKWARARQPDAVGPTTQEKVAGMRQNGLAPRPAARSQSARLPSHAVGRQPLDGQAREREQQQGGGNQLIRNSASFLASLPECLPACLPLTIESSALQCPYPCLSPPQIRSRQAALHVLNPLQQPKEQQQQQQQPARPPAKQPIIVPLQKLTHCLPPPAVCEESSSPFLLLAILVSTPCLSPSVWVSPSSLPDCEPRRVLRRSLLPSPPLGLLVVITRFDLASIGVRPKHPPKAAASESILSHPTSHPVTRHTSIVATAANMHFSSSIGLVAALLALAQLAQAAQVAVTQISCNYLYFTLSLTAAEARDAVYLGVYIGDNMISEIQFNSAYANTNTYQWYAPFFQGSGPTTSGTQDVTFRLLDTNEEPIAAYPRITQPLAFQCGTTLTTSTTALGTATSSSPRASNTSGGGSSGSANDSGSGSGSSSSTGAIAGGVAGGVAALVIVGLIAFCLMRKKKKQNQQQSRLRNDEADEAAFRAPNNDSTTSLATAPETANTPMMRDISTKNVFADPSTSAFSGAPSGTSTQYSALNNN
ncbi:hypothetical protein PANT_8c00009, partial [Moesziomyces antarcticus T-34]